MMSHESVQAPDIELTERQKREISYHRAKAERNQEIITQQTNFDIIESKTRRPWNGYWCAYDELLAANIEGKAVLIPGCGYGDDAIRIARLGAHVYASDLSPELVEIARRRAALQSGTRIEFSIGPAENLKITDNSIDLVFWNDILHHADIPSVLEESRRVLKPGARVIVNELYTHSALQRIRDSDLVSRVVYGRMVKFIYGTNDPYITKDERKINENELALLEAFLRPDARLRYFDMLSGRLVPARFPMLATFDGFVLNRMDSIGRLLAARFVLTGTVAK